MKNLSVFEECYRKNENEWYYLIVGKNYLPHPNPPVEGEYPIRLSEHGYIYTGKYLEDCTNHGVFRKGNWSNPHVLIEMLSKDKSVFSNDIVCFDSIWNHLAPTSEIDQIKISRCGNRENIGKIPRLDLFYYIREMKKSGIFPKSWHTVDILLNKPLPLILKDYFNPLQLYNTVNAIRNIWNKPQLVVNCVNFHKLYDLEWWECIFLSNTITTYDQYYSILNLGCMFKDYGLNVFDARFKVDMLEVFKELCLSPKTFGEVEQINSSLGTRFQIYQYIKPLPCDTYMEKIVRPTEFTVKEDKLMTVGEYLNGRGIKEDV